MWNHWERSSFSFFFLQIGGEGNFPSLARDATTKVLLKLVNKQHECINESMQTAEWFVTTTTLILFHRKPVKDTEGERLAPRARVSSPKK